MPLIRFDMYEGRSETEIKKILDVSHRVMVEAFQVPERDRYQIVSQHKSYEMVIEDTGLGFSRSENVLIISVTSRYRTPDQKQTFYKSLTDELERQCGITPNDVMVSFTINNDEDWSFGFGEAQFLTGKLT
ncbi:MULTISPECIES: tautomerase family protein [Bacillaceae]|uniref:tautomerase family protein n=1 Tax=Bacillaceae TaxID=186817 RepID=UPI001E3052CD|nr:MULTISPECIES: tautomerase family protein [Bacillaceae]MCE4050904.1 tautomerase family protein [Bacillus sp. Au-Bac7]MCM3029358.1 tautomerase family protein [Niallia sp. MER 6]MDL0434453.1 tautomerase family protein [Niallia sp. SS-2023]UPO88574.1 tautomerase family protein [Niallia sp. Man26]